MELPHIINQNSLLALMNKWERLFSNLESTDFSYRKNLKRLKKGLFFIKIKKNDLVLDLFCGRCDTGCGLKNHGYRITSGDISFKLLKINRDVKNKIQLNSLSLPFYNSQFKAIIIQGGLHHLENYDQIVICLQEIKRILEPNGYLFISEPGNTLCLKIWLFLITQTSLWKLSSYASNWHDLYRAEEKTHLRYLCNINKLTDYLKRNWIVEIHRVGIVTEFFTLRKSDCK